MAPYSYYNWLLFPCFLNRWQSCDQKFNNNNIYIQRYLALSIQKTCSQRDCCTHDQMGATLFRFDGQIYSDLSQQIISVVHKSIYLFNM